MPNLEAKTICDILDACEETDSVDDAVASLGVSIDDDDLEALKSLGSVDRDRLRRALREADGLLQGRMILDVNNNVGTSLG